MNITCAKKRFLLVVFIAASLTLPNLVHGFYIGLQSVNGQWLCAENGGGGTVVANRTGMGSWER
ncbi:MAG: fascin domain-containing protein, partial [Opitutaceae bacterium]